MFGAMLCRVVRLQFRLQIGQHRSVVSQEQAALLPSRTNCQLTNPPSLFTVGLEGERVADFLYIWLFGMLGVNAFVIILVLAHAMQQPDP